MSECQMFLEVGRASYVCQLTTISVQFYTEIAILKKMTPIPPLVFISYKPWYSKRPCLLGN